MYDLIFGQNGHFNKKNTNQKNHMSLMIYAFSQNEHPFGQCGDLKLFKNHDIL
jgi:hypothetical protein